MNKENTTLSTVQNKSSCKSGGCALGNLPRLRFPEFRDAGSWEGKPISKLLTIGSGKDYKHLSKGDIPVYGTGGYMLSVDDYLYDGESVCIGRKGTIDKPMFLTGKFWTVDTLFYTHSFNECLPKFIYSCFQNINWKNHNEAGGVPSLTKVIINKIEIKIPSPKEQQKIANCLTSLDLLITVHAQKLDMLKTHKKGLMQQFFPSEGKTVPNYRFPEFRNAGDWEVSSIGEIALVSSGGTPSRTKKDYWNGKIPWVTTTLIDFNTIGVVNEYITEIGLKNSSTKILPQKTILMAMYGQGKTRGKVAILGIQAAINQACAAITLKKGMNVEFVFQNLAARYNEIRRISNQGGQENLSGTLIKKIPFSYPDTQTNEQQKIANCLTSLDQLITAQAEKIEQLKAHKKGLMQQLFPRAEEMA